MKTLHAGISKSIAAGFSIYFSFVFSELEITVTVKLLAATVVLSTIANRFRIYSQWRTDGLQPLDSFAVDFKRWASSAKACTGFKSNPAPVTQGYPAATAHPPFIIKDGTLKIR